MYFRIYQYHAFMNRIIVPVDFTDTARNAARYALQLGADTRSEVFFYHSYEDRELGTDGTPLDSDPQALRTIAETALENFRAEFSDITNVRIITVAEPGTLVEDLERYVRHHGIGLIVSGINWSTPLEQLIAGSMTLALVNRNICPVIIVPQEARYFGIENVAFASDLRDVERTTPVEPLKAFLNVIKPMLHVVHVIEEKFVQPTDDFQAQRQLLEGILADYQPTFTFIRDRNFVDAINDFIDESDIDLVITLPRHHSFFDNLFRGSHTRKLAYNSHIPILAIHE